MNRLYILLTVMVVMVGALFAGHQALAKVLDGTAGDDTLVWDGHKRPLHGSPRSRQPHGSRRGGSRLKGSRGNDPTKGPLPTTLG